MTTAHASALSADDTAALLRLVDDVVGGAADDGELRRRLVEQGVWSAAMPVAVGGGGVDADVSLAVAERLARRRPPVAVAYSHAYAAARLLADDPAWTDVAGRIALGGAVAVVAAAGPRSRVRLSFEPSGVTATGSVLRVDVGSPAPVLVLVPPTGSPASVLVLRPDLPGVEHLDELERSGLAGAETHEVVLRVEGVALDEVAVTATAVDEALVALNLHLTSTACGLAEAALDEAERYVRVRQQFGVALSEMPTVQEHTARCRASTSSARAHAVHLARAPATDVLAASTARTRAFEAAISVTATAVQLHGGYGYLSEYPVERMLRDAVSLRAAGSV